jgi:hypothetical protein
MVISGLKGEGGHWDNTELLAQNRAKVQYLIGPVSEGIRIR